jgi:hypothetical protein
MLAPRLEGALDAMEPKFSSLIRSRIEEPLRFAANQTPMSVGRPATHRILACKIGLLRIFPLESNPLGPARSKAHRSLRPKRRTVALRASV